MVQPGFTVTVGTSSTTILNSDVNRVKVWLSNDSPTQIIYVTIGSTAVVGQGVRLNPNGGKWETSSTGAINAISTASGGTIVGGGQ